MGKRCRFIGANNVWTWAVKLTLKLGFLRKPSPVQHAENAAKSFLPAEFFLSGRSRHHSHVLMTYPSLCVGQSIKQHYCLTGWLPAHEYPADLFRRAKINSVLDWHHSNLRRGAVTYVVNTVLGPVLGLRPDPQAAAEAEKLLSSSLSKIESIWLKGNGKFLLGGLQPSIADLSLACEIMQLELLDEKDRIRILGPHKKVQQAVG
ncbi:hypothetical protein L484_024295 [Morus notabilis]|uniref:GST C-terminal domain-containing protein n=1 Tax=Morus notabilis TaxID=981085 RepID=W9QPN8_9ROSA|nr:hypothetical protein L484_024295 [Morus notabilis]